jgi:hypothetical protein
MNKATVNRCVIGYLDRRRDALQAIIDTVPYRSPRYEDAVLELDEVEGLLRSFLASIRNRAL